MTKWNPSQYQRFSDERLRPALELVERVPLQEPRVVYDLGCGTGNVTRLLAERFPSARVHGVDSSSEMLEVARRGGGQVDWIECDIGEWTPDEPPGLIYSNAALHWLERHDELFPRLVGSLRGGGCLAVQMPLSWPSDSHRLMRETLADGGAGGRPLGSDQLRRSLARRPVADAVTYYDLLCESARALDIWETEYLHALQGEDPVLEWVKGTGLRPVLENLTDDDRDVFLGEYRHRLRRAYPTMRNGRTPYPFRRLFIVALVRD